MFVLKILTLVTFIAMLTMNGLANAIPLGGNTTGEISEKYDSLFTPAGFTFSIWGVIYLLLALFVLLLFISPNTLTVNASIVLSLFIVVNLLNIAWLFAWHYDLILLSTIVMVLFLAVIITLMQFISRENTLAFITFSIYAGWISVATIANITILIVKHQMPLFMNYQTTWFVIVLIISFVIGAIMLIKERNFYFAGVFLWAYIGIASKFI